MAKKLAVFKLVRIAKAMDELQWYTKDKWPKRLIKQLRKRLRKGA